MPVACWRGCSAAPSSSPRSSPTARRDCRGRRRRGPAVDRADRDPVPVRDAGRRARWHRHPCGRSVSAVLASAEPRRGGLRRPRHLRPAPLDARPAGVRVRQALLLGALRSPGTRCRSRWTSCSRASPGSCRYPVRRWTSRGGSSARRAACWSTSDRVHPSPEPAKEQAPRPHTSRGLPAQVRTPWCLERRAGAGSDTRERATGSADGQDGRARSGMWIQPAGAGPRTRPRTRPCPPRTRAAAARPRLDGGRSVAAQEGLAGCARSSRSRPAVPCRRHRPGPAPTVRRSRTSAASPRRRAAAESSAVRSASGRAGSPSKSMSRQPMLVRSVWPRCRSPWMRCTRTGAVAPAHRVEAPRARAVAVGRAPAPSARPRSKRCANRSASAGSSSAGPTAPLGSRRAMPSCTCRVAAPSRSRLAGEVAARVLGRACRARRAGPARWSAPTPSPRSRCAGTPAGSRGRTASLARSATCSSHPYSRGTVSESRGERARAPRRRGCARAHPAEELEHGALVDDQRGVALLRRQQHRRRVRRQARGRRPARSPGRADARSRPRRSRRAGRRRPRGRAAAS